MQRTAKARRGPATPSSPEAVCGRLSFLAWGAVSGRSAEIAAELGGEARCFFAAGGRRWRLPVPLRYLLCAIATALYLLRRRPDVVIVTNPPIPGALFTYACARALGATVVLDSHPGAFGVMGDTVSARLQPLHRFLARRVAAVMVTDERWSRAVEEWGGKAVIVHEAPGPWALGAPARHERLRLLVVNRFNRDEPVEVVVEAARRLPACDFLVTGSTEKCPPELQRARPENVSLVGFLAPEAYRSAMAECDAVITLTTEPTSVMRAAYEAVYARRPLVVSDSPASRRHFHLALHVANDPASLTAAVERLDSHYDDVAARLDDARWEQLARWSTQRSALVSAIDRGRESEHRCGGRQPLMGVALDHVTERAAVERVVASAALGRGGRVCSLNVDILRQAVADAELRRSINRADLVLADGMPIVWASRLRGAPVPERVPVSEMIWPTIADAVARGVGVFLLGGAPGTAQRAATAMSARFPGLRVGHLCPEIQFDDPATDVDAIVDAIVEAGAGVVFCGFGAPKQERLMALLVERLPQVWFIACGGTFSMVVGDAPKAPKWMRQRGLEWVHRLRLEPRRLFPRYVVHDIPFALRLFAWSAAHRGRPLELAEDDPGPPLVRAQAKGPVQNGRPAEPVALAAPADTRSSS